jgi:hypothetical protein
LQIFDLEDVEVAALGKVPAKAIYTAFTDTLPPPKVEAKFRDMGWIKIWSCQCKTGLPPPAALLARLVGK